MGLRVAIQMDPVERLNPAGDSTLLLAYEASRRGHKVWHYTPDALSCRSGGALTAKGRRFTVHALGQKGDYTLDAVEKLALAEMDVILLRQDPPFDMTYLTTTFMLEGLATAAGKTPLVVNNPREVRNHPEKWFPLQFPDLVPPTLISRDPEELRAFRREQGEIVLKPLYGFGGRSVFHIGPQDRNFLSFLELYFERSAEPIIAQRFAPEVQEAEKRIVIIDDYVAPVLNRLPPEGEIRSNLRIGAQGRKVELTPRQRETVERLVPELQKRGLLLVGLDMIGDWLIEINITSPTGLRWIDEAYGVRLGQVFWEKIEARLT
jgi:glutathione synthase